MWYFTWILGLLLACAFGIINAPNMGACLIMHQNRSVLAEPRVALTYPPTAVNMTGLTKKYAVGNGCLLTRNIATQLRLNYHTPPAFVA